jgi:hypothetical protein
MTKSLFRDNHSSSFGPLVNYAFKKFYNIELRTTSTVRIDSEAGNEIVQLSYYKQVSILCSKNKLERLSLASLLSLV